MPTGKASNRQAIMGSVVYLRREVPISLFYDKPRYLITGCLAYQLITYDFASVYVMVVCHDVVTDFKSIKGLKDATSLYQ